MARTPDSRVSLNLDRTPDAEMGSPPSGAERLVADPFELPEGTERAVRFRSFMAVLKDLVGRVLSINKLGLINAGSTLLYEIGHLHHMRSFSFFRFSFLFLHFVLLRPRPSAVTAANAWNPMAECQ